jgi:putative phage-type endonuclease
MEQRTPEWFKARAGKVTASRIADVMAKTKTGYSTSRQNYLAQLVAERLTGAPQDSYSNAAMQWGTETEPLARAVFENAKGLFVDETGFHDHPIIEWAGASPDGLIGDKGLIEIKCPNTSTHIEYLLSKKVPNKYILQMQWQMDCTGRDFCEFMSFDPRMPDKHQSLIIRVERDETLLDEIRNEVTSFLGELDNTLNLLAAA